MNPLAAAGAQRGFVAIEAGPYKPENRQLTIDRGRAVSAVPTSGIVMDAGGSARGALLPPNPLLSILDTRGDYHAPVEDSVCKGSLVLAGRRACRRSSGPRLNGRPGSARRARRDAHFATRVVEQGKSSPRPECPRASTGLHWQRGHRRRGLRARVSSASSTIRGRAFSSGSPTMRHSTCWRMVRDALKSRNGTAVGISAACRRKLSDEKVSAARRRPMAAREGLPCK